MKVACIVIFSLAYFAAVSAHPASKPELNEEIEIIPLEDQFGRQPIVDTGMIGGPIFNPFDGLLESLTGMMARMRQQMDYLLKKLPSGNRNSTNAESPAFPGFPNIGDLDLGKGNTTSVTKVIDGHKVVINETEYKQEGDLGGAFFKVRIIDFQPDSTELTTEQNAEEIPKNSSPKDTEKLDGSFENEIPKNTEAEVFSNLETFDEPDNSPPQIADRRNFFETLGSLESLEGNSIEDAHHRHPVDLSRDIYVNQLLADAGAPINPDAEVFSRVESNVPFATVRQPFEKMINPR